MFGRANTVGLSKTTNAKKKTKKNDRSLNKSIELNISYSLKQKDQRRTRQ